MTTEIVKAIAASIAAELREHPEHFTKGAYARDDSGELCDVSSPRAVCWCLAGLIAKRHNRWPKERYAASLGSRAIGQWSTGPKNTGARWEMSLHVARWSPMADPTELHLGSQALIDSGRIVQAGWFELSSIAVKTDDPARLSELRTVFFCGAQQVYAALSMALDGDHEISPEALKERIRCVGAELNDYFDSLIKGTGVNTSELVHKNG